MRLSKGRACGAGPTRAACSAAAVTVAWPGRETLLQRRARCGGNAPRSLEDCAATNLCVTRNDGAACSSRCDDGICSLHLRPHLDGIGLALGSRLRVAGEGYRLAGVAPTPANPGRRGHLGRTGVANLNWHLLLLFLSLLPQHIAIHLHTLSMLSFPPRPNRRAIAPVAAQAGARHADWHRRPPRTEPHERSANPRHSDPEASPCMRLSTPFLLHV